MYTGTPYTDTNSSQPGKDLGSGPGAQYPAPIQTATPHKQLRWLYALLAVSSLIALSSLIGMSIALSKTQTLQRDMDEVRLKLGLSGYGSTSSSTATTLQTDAPVGVFPTSSTSVFAGTIITSGASAPGPTLNARYP